MRRPLTVAIALLGLSVLVAACSLGPTTRVLFVGNSYTFSNDLPGAVRDLAGAAGHRLVVDIRAEGGWWLEDHAGSVATLDRIADGNYDYVVLQEQSQISSIPTMAVSVTRPAARELAVAAVESGARVVLFMTWGHRDGSAEADHDSYQTMQIAVSNTYTELGRALAARVARVGAAWWIARSERPDIDLYQPDGSHPSREGTYLAAAVITATVLSIDVQELDDPLDIDPDRAEALLSFADRAVLGEIPWR